MALGFGGHRKSLAKMMEKGFLRSRSLGQTRLVLRVHEVSDIISLVVSCECYFGAFRELEKIRVRIDVLNWLYDSILGLAFPLVVSLLANIL